MKKGWMWSFLMVVVMFLILPVLLLAEEVGAGEPAKGIGAMLLGLDVMVGGGLLAVIVKLLLDMIKKVVPQRVWLKRLFPVIAPALAMSLWALWQVLTTGIDFTSVLQVGLIGGLGATGLHEIVNTAVMGRVNPVQPVIK